MMKSMVYKFALLSMVFFGANVELYAQQQDRCGDIIPLGFYDKTSVTNTGNFTSDVKGWLVSDKLSDYANGTSGGFSLGIPIDGVPLQIGANSSSSDYQKLRQYLNSGNGSKINNSFANYVAQQVVNQAVVDAWSKCMSNNGAKSGLQASYEGDVEGNYFNLLIFWGPRMNVSSCKLSTPYILGASYDTSNLKIGLVIGTEPIRIPVIRENNNIQIIITLNTQENIGSATLTIPKFNAVVPVTTSNECLCANNGDVAACKKYRDEIKFKHDNHDMSDMEYYNERGAINNIINSMEITVDFDKSEQFKAMKRQNKIMRTFMNCN